MVVPGAANPRGIPGGSRYVKLGLRQRSVQG